MANNPLEEQIIAEIRRTNSPMDFKRFMHLCLYDPDHGYYTTQVNLGTLDEHYTTYDFLTYPDRFSPYFGTAFAKVISQFSEFLPNSEICIAEMGAGRGTFAKDMLDYFKKKDEQLYERIKYGILDISPRLIKVQQETLAEHSNVFYVNSSQKNVELSPINGFVITNELPDVFPVDVALNVQGEGLCQLCVLEEDGKLEFTYKQIDDELSLHYLQESDYPSYMEEVSADPTLKEIFSCGIPINLDMVNWYDELARAILSGAIITIDYGFKNAREHAKTKFNKIRTYQKDNLKSGYNPLSKPGKIDMTSDINFEILQRIGRLNGLNDLFLGHQDEIIQGFTELDVPSGKHYLALMQGRNLPKLRFTK